VSRTTPSATTPAGELPQPSRRAFCCSAASLLLARPLLAIGQPTPADAAATTRVDVAAIDHDRILAAAGRYLTQPPTPLTSLQCPRSHGTVHDYYSEFEPTPDPGSAATAPAGSTQKPGSQPSPFTAHRDALFELGLAVTALASAWLLTSEQRYAQQAALHLRTWFVDPATRMMPSLDYAQSPMLPDDQRVTIQTNSDFGAAAIAPATGRFEGLLEALPLVEVAQSIPFLAASTALSDTALTTLHAWFADYLRWLTAPEDSGPRLPALARDHKDHHATSWLLQASAYANLAVPPGDAPRSEDNVLAGLRHRFKTVTLRAQIAPDGTFKHELGSATPYRDSLFNLDMMAGICQLLSTRFESVWDYQLEDGPGMRSAIAYHFPYIANRDRWPFRADAQHFSELPGRRASLLFSARPYQRPEYAALWKTLSPDPPTPEVLRTLPIHQPLLWVRQPPALPA
jgi:hypothetical protein